MNVTELQGVRRGSVFEFPARITESGSLDIPSSVAKAITPGQIIRIIIVMGVEPPNEDQVWGLLGAHQLTTRDT